MPPEIFSSTKLHMIRDLNHFYCTSKLDISFKLFTELSFFCCRCFKLTFIHFLFFIIIDLLSTFSLFSSLNWSVMTDNWSIITLNHMTYTKWYHQQVTMYDTFQAQQCRDTAYINGLIKPMLMLMKVQVKQPPHLLAEVAKKSTQTTQVKIIMFKL